MAFGLQQESKLKEEGNSMTTRVFWTPIPFMMSANSISFNESPIPTNHIQPYCTFDVIPMLIKRELACLILSDDDDKRRWLKANKPASRIPRIVWFQGSRALSEILWD